MKSDIEIAREAKPRPVNEIAAQLGIPPEHLVPYGHTKAKLNLDYVQGLEDRPDGRLILVTAMSPTPAGDRVATSPAPVIADRNAHTPPANVARIRHSSSGNATAWCRAITRFTPRAASASMFGVCRCGCP